MVDEVGHVVDSYLVDRAAERLKVLMVGWSGWFWEDFWGEWGDWDIHFWKKTVIVATKLLTLFFVLINFTTFAPKIG